MKLSWRTKHKLNKYIKTYKKQPWKIIKGYDTRIVTPKLLTLIFLLGNNIISVILNSSMDYKCTNFDVNYCETIEAYIKSKL